MQQEYAARGVQVVTINIQDSYPLEVWKRFWLDIPGSGEVVWAQDKGFQAASAFQVRALGTTVIVDRRGRVAYRDEGATSYATLRAAVEGALRE